MAYSDSKTLRRVVEEFELTYESVPDFFPNARPVAPGPSLTWMLAHRASKALLMGSGRARRESIIAPFLFEAEAQAALPVVVYSGMPLDVDERLRGEVDYVMGRGSPRPWVESPILVVVEAEEENFTEGGGECAAAMIGARELNASKGVKRPIYGCVTIGTQWLFYRLTGNAFEQQINLVPYRPPERLLGTLVAIAESSEGGPSRFGNATAPLIPQTLTPKDLASGASPP